MSGLEYDNYQMHENGCEKLKVKNNPYGIEYIYFNTSMIFRRLK